MSKESLYQKIVKVMTAVGKLQKDGEIKDRNGKKMYSYLSEEQTTSTLQKSFIEVGLVMFPIEVKEEFFYIEGFQYDKAFKNPVTKVIVTYKIVDTETGESETLQSIGYGTDNADKGSNKAMTNAFKYVQRQTFMIASGEDADHTASDEHTERYSRPTSPQRHVQTSQQQRIPNTPPPADADLAAIQQASEQNRTGQSQGTFPAMARVYKLREQIGMPWGELNVLAGNLLNREIKFLKSHVKTNEEWELIEQALKEAAA